jgi:hypothetical protein
MASVQVVNVSLPSLPSGWTADKDFKPVGGLSPATQRTIEPVGPHFLAHARRVCDPVICLLMWAALSFITDPLIEASPPHFL